MDWGQHIYDISSKVTKTRFLHAEFWLLHLRVLRKLHTKLWYTLNLNMQHLFRNPNSKTQIQQVEKVQRKVARWTCRRWCNSSSVGYMLDELQWPTLETWRDQSSLLLYHKIHCGTTVKPM